MPVPHAPSRRGARGRPRRAAPAARSRASRRSAAAAMPATIQAARAPQARLHLALSDHAHVERLARRFRALGDPTRSKLVYALSMGELCVSDLAGALGASLSATSHQLRILRDLDIVRVRRSGKSQLYALNEDAFGFCSPRSCMAWKTAFDPGLERSV